MELRQLRYFVRVVEQGSMSRAALDLDVVQSALAAAFTRSESTRRHDIEAMLRRTDVSSARAGHTDEVVPMIVKMLERRRRGR